MGSQSDYKTMKLVEKILKIIGIKFETKIISPIEHQKECTILRIQLSKMILVL